ncbi:MAG TPA: LamG domain-containing protein, partial [Polyangiaceae bacterium]|nr:LamG domain-containing protein [Polyangiaceae bacterium]
FNDLIQWSAPGIEDSEARFHASLNTCNGCHGPETNSGFLQISPRFPGSGEAILAPFITGTVVFDPFTGEPRTLNDLARRREDLTQLVCPPGTETGSPPPPPPPGLPPALPPPRVGLPR